MKIAPSNLKEFGIVDEIVSEPKGGAHKDHDSAADLLKVAITKQLKKLKKLNGEEMRNQRYERFRALGSFLEN